MLRKLLIFTFTSVVLLALNLPFSAIKSTPVSSAYPAIDAYIENFIHQYRVPGVAVAIVKDEQIVYARGFGIADSSGRPVTAQTPFIIGSTSKSYTALAVMQLVEAGLIDLDAPVRQYLSWFNLGEGALTVRQLLNHTSGIPRLAGQESQSSNLSDSGALERQVRGLNGWKLSHQPGTEFEYANANYQIAGLIVQTVSGESFETYVQKHIFEPLDMQHSFTSKSEAQKAGLASGYHYWFGFPLPSGYQPYPRMQFPSGYYISSAEDMAHALIAHLNDGVYRGRQLLSAHGIEILHHPVLADYAMGWAVYNGVLSHNGSVPDFGSQILIDPRHHLGIVILFNISNALGTDHLYILAPNILNLLTNSILAPTPSNSLYKTYMLLLPFLLVVEIVWLVWSMTTLKRWQKLTAARPHGVRAALGLGIPFLIEYGLAVYLWILISSEGIWNALLYQPDFTILVILICSLLIVWSSIRTLISMRLVLQTKTIRSEIGQTS